MQLIKYDAARKALIAAHSIDEVKQIKDKFEAIRAYARQTKDLELTNWASEIRIRAERRMGEMLRDQEMNKGGTAEKKSYQSHTVTSRTPTLSEVGITKSMSSRAQKIAAVPEEEFEDVISEYKEESKELTSAIMQKLIDGPAHVGHNSGNNEWYTPFSIIDYAIQVMQKIDLDPASSEIANKTVGAKTFYTKEDDGLSKKWFGNVWLNPPYAQPLIQQFSDKLCFSVDDMDIEQAMVLVNNATETDWFQNMAKRASAICFINKRLKFLDPDGVNSGAPLQGQAILYYGDEIDKFADIFNLMGFVLVHA